MGILPMWFIPIGTLKYRGVQFPIRKGPASVSVDLWLDPLIPSEMVCTTTRFKASTKSGKNFVCVDVHTHGTVSFAKILGPLAHMLPLTASLSWQIARHSSWFDALASTSALQPCSRFSYVL